MKAHLLNSSKNLNMLIRHLTERTSEIISQESKRQSLLAAQFVEFNSLDPTSPSYEVQKAELLTKHKTEIEDFSLNRENRWDFLVQMQENEKT